MERREIAISIILSIVTCGIYSIYWLYKIAYGFYVTQTRERVNTTPGVTILLWVVTCGIYGYYCYYKWGRASAEIASQYGRNDNDKAILYLVLAIFGLSIVNSALIQNDFNDWISQGPNAGQPPFQGPPPPQGPFQGPPPQGPYQGPYQGPPPQGPYQGQPPQQGTYQGPPPQGPYQAPPSIQQGPYQGPPPTEGP